MNFGELTVTLSIVILSRVFWFLLERALFRYCVESVAKAKSSAVVLGAGVRRLRKSLGGVGRKGSGKIPVMRQVRGGIVGRLSSFMKLSSKSRVTDDPNEKSEYTNDDAIADARQYILEVMQSNSEWWKVAMFSVASNVR